MSGVFHCKFNSDLPFMVRCLMTFHVNGQEREKALRNIGESLNGEELPFILLRLNDWVRPIQSLAKDLIRKRLKDRIYSEYFLRDIFLVDRLKDCWRWSHEEILDEMYRFIVEGNPQSILKVILEGNRHASFAAFSLYEKVFPEEIKSLVLTALNSPHSGLHLKCSDKIKLLSDNCFLDILDFLMDSRPPLRIAAIRSFCERFPTQKLEFLKQILLNSSSYVREFAVWTLTRIDDDFDAAHFFRNAVNTELTVSGLKSLGQFGDLSDEDFLLDVLKNGEFLKFKKAALESLVKIGSKNSKHMLYEHLGEEGFSKVSRRLLSSKITSEDVETFYELLLESNELTKRNVEKLIVFLPDVDHGFLLMKLSLELEKYREKLCSFLCRSNFYCTNQKNKNLLIQMFEDNKELFSIKQQRSLELSFRYWRN